MKIIERTSRIVGKHTNLTCIVMQFEPCQMRFHIRALCVPNTSSSSSILLALRLRAIGLCRVDRLADRLLLVNKTSLSEFLVGLDARISKCLTSTFFISFSTFPFLTTSDLLASSPEISFDLKYIWIINFLILPALDFSKFLIIMFCSRNF